MVLNLLVGKAATQPVNIQQVRNLLNYDTFQVRRDDRYNWDMWQESRKTFAAKMATLNKDKKYKFVLTNDERLAKILAKKYPFSFIVILAKTHMDGTIKKITYYKNDGGD